MKGNKFMRYVTLALLCFVVGMPLVASSDEPASVVVPDPISSPVEKIEGIRDQLDDVAKSLKTSTPEPTPAPPIVVAPDFVAITTADGTRIDNTALEKLVTDLPAGEFVALLVPKPGAKLQTLRISIVVQGSKPPPVVVVPPVVDPSVPVEPAPPVTPNDKITTVTYVYEKDETAIPSAVHAALNRLNRERGIVATVFEKDTFDGDDQIPEQYKAARVAALDKGLPCLVVLAGDKVVRTAKAPTTEAEVLEAAQ